ncbi:hypothetical protein N7462_010891 [Penicillium macrosclerotiorum]|uniref:uncharacterized protein n=1 Tax=Penicillium macrosclerotiorum TaxID=303699 RepID=UPI0025466023|nr:uncharacterized protein N7462_010891 [Penicillium macrosclerotiorum]KAJ5669821.1 hypothetical protein N7462_010891 [Penicillium macrosclerotiorum]
MTVCDFMPMSFSHLLTKKGHYPLPVGMSDQNDPISDLASKLRQPNSIFTEALQLLESMQSSPSCTRVAATKLVASCQNFGANNDARPEIHPVLEHIRSVYAARLAICELDGAGASIPTPCLPVSTPLPTPSKSRFGFLYYSKSSASETEAVPKAVIEECLRALESRPQWWTSYSNNRQNALIICQASRIEIEKEELLDLHRSLVKSTVKLDEGLQESLRNAVLLSSEHQIFLKTVRALNERLSADLKSSDSTIRNSFSSLLHDIEAGFDKVIATVTSAINRVQTKTSFLEDKIRNASSHTDSLQRALQAAHADTVSRNDQTLQLHQENVMVSQQLTTNLHLSLASLMETDLARLSQRVESVDIALEWLTSRLIAILEQENRISERLQSIDALMKQSIMKADELHEVQRLHTEAMAVQAQAQESMRFSTQVSQALLDRAISAASDLQDIIDGTAEKYKQTPGLHRGGLSVWTLCLLLLIIIGGQNIKVAIGLFFFIFGMLENCRDFDLSIANGLTLGHLIATSIFPFFKLYETSVIPI